MDQPYGFRNLGATCYFNALLQGILSCRSFKETILQNQNKEEYVNNEVAKKFVELYNIMSDDTLDDSQKSAVHMNFAPQIWREVFACAMKRQDNVKFTPGQECVREGFHLLLESMDGLKEVEKLFNHRYRTLIYCKNCDDWVVKKDDEYSLFEVQPNLKSQQLPEFKNIDPLFNQARPLVDFIQKQNSYVDDDFRCPRCKQKKAMFQTTKLIMIPKILPILAKKYGIDGRRKSLEVTPFPIAMEVKDKFNGVMEYNAVCQIEHMGNMNGGHYNCRAFRNNDWYLIDDSRYTKAPFMPTKNTYLVFYELN